MSDIDSVTKALRHHATKSGCIGKKCPYYTGGCTAAMASEALAVINAQRETLDEIDRYVRELDQAVNSK